MLAVFLLFAAVTQVVVEPLPLYFMALDAQPYALSWLLGLASFLLWRAGSWWTTALGGVLALLAIGLNPSVVLGVAVLAVGQLLRTRQWIRWPAFGLVWLAGLAAWTFVAARYPPVPGPFPSADPDYYAFHLHLFTDGVSRSTAGIGDAFRPTTTMLLAVLAVASLLVVPARVRTALLIRVALLAAFAVGYWALFTGNAWVAANDWGIRYYFPVLVTVVLGLATPIAAALLSVRVGDAVPVAVAATACALAGIGPQTPLADARVLTEVDATAGFARSAGIHYVAGSYWYAWPVLHRMLSDGRDAAFATTVRSDGNPAAYRAPFDRDLSADRRPRAICVNDSADSCATYLTYWTEPGWSTTPVGTCPAPPLPDASAGTCVVLEFTGSPAS